MALSSSNARYAALHTRLVVRYSLVRRHDCALAFSTIFTNFVHRYLADEPHHEKTCFLYIRKRRRSAAW